MGKLFVIDGTDGSGKQTQFKKLQERLDKEGIDYKRVSFPNYDDASSSLVKMYLSGEFGENAKDVSPYIASTFSSKHLTTSSDGITILIFLISSWLRFCCAAPNVISKRYSLIDFKYWNK